MDIGPGITGKYYFPDTGLAALPAGDPRLFLSFPERCILRQGASGKCSWPSALSRTDIIFPTGPPATRPCVPFLLEKDRGAGCGRFPPFTWRKGQEPRRYKECGGSGRMYLISTEDFHQKELYDVIPFYAALLHLKDFP